MKYAVMLTAAILPFAAAAQDMQTDSFNAQEVQGDWRISEMIGSDVESNDGKEVGELKDVVIGADGKIVSVLVEASDEFLQEQGGGQRMGADGTAMDDGMGSTVADTGAETSTVATTTEEDSRDSSRENGGMMRLDGGSQLVALEWNNPSFMQEEGVLRIDTSLGMGQQLVTYESEEEAVQQGSEHRASELLGMDVNLADQEGYGQIEDILVSQDGSASAFVIEAGGFFSSETYAIPAEFENVSAEQEAVSLQMTAQEVEASGEFDPDKLTEST